MSAVAMVVATLAGSVMAHRWRGARIRRRLGLGGRRVAIDRPGLAVAWLGPRLWAADLDWSAVTIARWASFGAAGLAVLAITGRSPAPAVITVLVTTGALGGLYLARGRREARLEAELPALLEAVARALRSGATLPVALEEAATGGSAAAEELREVLSDGRRGLGLAQALDRWVERRPRPAIRLVVGAITVALVAGGSPARGVDGVAATLRDRAEVEREARSLATQARTSAVVVTLAPLGFGALGALGDRASAGFLLRSPAGLACLGAGLVLDAVGAVWMHRIARGPA